LSHAELSSIVTFSAGKSRFSVVQMPEGWGWK